MQITCKIFPFRFLGLTLLLTWIPWIIAVTAGFEMSSPGGVILFAIGGIGPTIAAIIMLYHYGDTAARKDYWDRVVNFKRISAKWYIILFTTVPAILLISIVISTFFGKPFGAQLLERQYLENLLKLIPFIVFVFFFGPLPEELGWRGYALDGLKVRSNGLIASLILGVVHAAWHIPLFYIEGYPLRDYLAQPLMMVVYFALIIPKAVVYTWLFYKTNRSTLSAILFHFMINYTGMITDISVITEFIQVVVYYVFAIILIATSPDIFLRSYARKQSIEMQ